MMASLLRHSVRKLRASDASAQSLGAMSLYSTAPALTSTKSSWSFLTGVFSRPPAQLPPLSEPLAGIVLPEAPAVEAPKVELTKLDNGLRIASEPYPGPNATVGIYIAAGSVYETAETSGISHLLERLAFKSTENRSHFRLVRELEAIGANPTATVGRDHTIYSIDAIKTYLPEVVEILADSVLNPVFHDWEVEKQVQRVKAEVQMASSQPQAFLMEAIHSAAFAGALGNPLLAPEGNLSNLTGDKLYEYVKSQYTPDRIVLAAAGVDHSELRAIAGPLFEDLPAGNGLQTPPSQYRGGEWRAGIQSEFTHFALAFELPGGWLNEKDSITSYVLQFLMGGGGAFSAGGPGKGMTSRLYRRILGGSSEMDSVYFFTNAYDNTGLAGVYAAASHDHAESAVDKVTKELLELANPYSVSQVDLQKAKRATLAAVLFALENRSIVAEDIGRQLLTYGERKPLEDFKGKLASVTAADISNLAQKMFKTPLTLTAIGNVGAIPPLETIASRFG